MASVSKGNTHGKDAMREVNIYCTECQRSESGMMQCNVGTHPWDCEECRRVTDHEVSEVHPRK
jgi:ribosomal protein L44E